MSNKKVFISKQVLVKKNDSVIKPSNQDFDIQQYIKDTVTQEMDIKDNAVNPLIIVQAGNNSQQGINTGINSTITNWTATVNTVSSAFVPVTGIFTAPYAGNFLVSANITFASSTNTVNTVLQAMIFVNGAAVFSAQTLTTASAGVFNTGVVTGIVTLSAGDTVRIRVNQNSGATRTLENSVLSNTLSIVELR